MSTNQYVLGMYWYVLSTYAAYVHASMVYYRGTPEHESTVEHGNKGRVTNPSLGGDVDITISECNRIYLILVVLHIRRARMQTDFLEEVFICLEVASPSMETQDAHEHILVVGKVCHCLDILDMGVLMKLIVSGRADEVCTRHVQSMY